MESAIRFLVKNVNVATAFSQSELAEFIVIFSADVCFFMKENQLNCFLKQMTFFP